MNEVINILITLISNIIAFVFPIILVVMAIILIILKSKGKSFKSYNKDKGNKK